VIVTEFDDPAFIARFGESSGPRTRDKVHLSDIYKILMKRLQPDRFDDARPMDMLKIGMGLLFERALERELAEAFAVVRPGEIVSDEGVHCSPDGVNPTEVAGEEYKVSYMSCRKGISETVEVDGVIYHIPLDKFVHWFIQMKGYAHVLGINDFILRALFVRGDYSSFPDKPLLKFWRIHFTDEEIQDNWSMLMTIAREEGLL
jgi:hypothetical protein